MTPDLDRLKRLARVILPSVRKEEFDFGTWKCGSRGCAVGHAASDPVFRNAGLKLLPKRGGTPVFGGEEQFRAAALFFAITFEEALELFDPNLYDQDIQTTAVEVIARIEELIARYEPTPRLESEVLDRAVDLALVPL